MKLFKVVEMIECDDDYGQPAARRVVTEFDTYAQAKAFANKSDAEFGVEIFQTKEI